eukprot:m.158417 g.158417  ORF g.158417 m.158417 type:complete len:585 (+) comp16468_c0_seq4:524-2278(+)
MAKVTEWLKTLKLESYSDAFAEFGYDTLDKVAQISSTALDDMGITLQGHRNRILKNLPKTDVDTGTSDMFGDLDDMMAGLQTEVDGMDPSLSQQAATLQDMPADDLDNILEDLWSFGQDAEPEVIHRTPEAAATDVVMTPSAAPVPAAVDTPTEERASLQRVSTYKPRTNSELQTRLTDFSKRMSNSGQMSQHDLENMMKEEKIRLAMEKMAAAQLQKFVIKVHLSDGTSKTLAVTTNETAYEVCRKIVVKNRLEDDPNWALMEVCPSLFLERLLEDHMSVGEAYNAWPMMGDYYFELRVIDTKYDLFNKAAKYFPSSFKQDLEEARETSERVEKAKRILLQEFFSSTNRLPDVKGWVLCRDGHKKWKKRFCVLRASGLYYSNKGESEASKDLIALLKFDDTLFCHGLLDFAKATKAPGPVCLCFRPNLRKQPIDLSVVQAMAFPDVDAMLPWEAGIRLAIFGVRLKEGYDETCRRFTELQEMSGSSSSKPKVSFENPQPKPVSDSNRQLIRQWQSQRASRKNPNVSAATGVEFDELDDTPDGRGVPPSLKSYLWFHGNISREEAEGLFRQHNNVCQRIDLVPI